MSWLAALLAGALVLAGCGPSDRFDARPLDQPGRQDVLAPYEAAVWPDYLRRIDLPRARDYVILAYVPPRRPLDLSSPERARLSLQAALLAPGPDTRIGHSIVAWQCGAQQGMASMTGAEGPEAIEMVKRGWGLVPLLSTYTDGRLYPEGAHRVANLDALAEGRGVVTAVEVSHPQCEALREELTRFLTHPDAPARSYGLMKDPAAYEGAGCISFGFYLTGAAGVLGEVAPHVTRELALRPAVLGRGDGDFPSVRLFQPPQGCCDRPLPLSELLFGRWDRGPVVARVRVEDGELMLAALVAARERAAASEDWRFDRVLRADRDRAVADAAAAGRRFAARYPVARIADPAGVSALVLERD
ncbi:MAG: hypothetical protein KDK53_18810 [Maritimibacter sp.]|nr:hypothetical protein [Maritimibacter sp.]